MKKNGKKIRPEFIREIDSLIGSARMSYKDIVYLLKNRKKSDPNTCISVSSYQGLRHSFDAGSLTLGTTIAILDILGLEIQYRKKKKVFEEDV